MSSKNVTRLERLEARPGAGRRILVAWPEDAPPVYLADGKPVAANEWESLLPGASTVIVVRRSDDAPVKM